MVTRVGKKDLFVDDKRNRKRGDNIPTCHTEHQGDKDGGLEDEVESDALDPASSIAIPVLEQGTAVELEGVEEERKNLNKKQKTSCSATTFWETAKVSSAKNLSRCV